MFLTRSAHFASPLGKALLLYTMTGRETLGRPYSYELDLLSLDDSLDLSKLLGRMCAVVIEHTDGTIRQLTGFATDFALVGEHGNYSRYRTTLRPFLWFLDQNRNCRIFQRKSVPEVVQEILKDAGFSDIELALHGHYDTWEFLVQYRESDLNFISRMLEHEGIYYFFKHEDGKHVLVLADSATAHHPRPGYEHVPYYPPVEREMRQVEHLDTWIVSRQLRQGRVHLRDFNFEYPLPFAGEKQGAFPEPNATFELYDFPAQINAKTNDEAKTATDLRAEIRLEEHQADYEVVRGSGPVRGLGAGDKFSLTQFPRDDQNKEYLIVACSYELRISEYESNIVSEKGQLFRFELSAIDAKRPYRSPRITRKPVVEGPQTATVVGDPGQEITTDEYGRVPIQFHWDRLGQWDQNSSCMVRVSQAWAGSGWGSMHIPRYGQEVIVHFLEGDPDRPIITGRVYNADNPAPYPQTPTQSGLKSHSTPGGSADNFNEIRFEDQKGEEELHIQAEKNMTTLVKNDQSTTVKANRSAGVTGNDSVSVGGDRSVSVTGNLSVTVKGGGKSAVHSTHSVTGKHSVDASDTIEMTAPTHIKLTVGGSSITITPSAITITASGSTITVDPNVFLTSSGKSEMMLDANAFVKASGGASALFDANLCAQSNAGDQILLDGNVAISSSGNVTLDGMTVAATGKTEASIAAGGSSVKATPASADVAGAMVNVNGSGMVSIAGGMVKIN